MSANLGKIALTIGGDHVISHTYERLTIVKSTTEVWYLSLWDVPANIPLTDQGYWVVFFDPNMNSQQVAANAQSIVELTQSLNGKASVSHTHNYAASNHTHSAYVPNSNVAVGAYNDNAVNKVVKRDGSGDIYARMFRMSYDTRNASCNLFATLVNTGSNNYIRTSTPAQVMAKLRSDTLVSQRGLKTTSDSGTKTLYFYPPSGYGMSGCLVAAFSKWDGWSETEAIKVYYESSRIKVVVYKISHINYSILWSK